MSTGNVIVVGVDGSHDAHRALEWAVGEGRRIDAAVLAITAWSGDKLVGTPRRQQARAEQISAREIAAVTAETGSSRPLAARVIEGRPADVLVEASRTARMLVLGSHGHRRLRLVVRGSTSEECLNSAVCPVVVLPAVPWR